MKKKEKLKDIPRNFLPNTSEPLVLDDFGINAKPQKTAYKDKTGAGRTDYYLPFWGVTVKWD